jgi:hypothetical protein
LLAEEAVATASEAVPEQVHRPPLEAPDRLAARDIRERRMAAVEAAGADGEVEGVQGDREHLDRPGVRRVHNARRSTELGDLGSTHGGIVGRAGKADRSLAVLVGSGPVRAMSFTARSGLCPQRAIPIVSSRQSKSKRGG